eukprot:3617672-Alexandrium_andersonii.AAC.1
MERSGRRATGCDVYCGHFACSHGGGLGRTLHSSAATYIMMALAVAIPRCWQADIRNASKCSQTRMC